MQHPDRPHVSDWLTRSLGEGDFRAVRMTLDRIERGQRPVNGDRAALEGVIENIETRLEAIQKRWGIEVALSPHVAHLKNELALGA